MPKGGKAADKALLTVQYASFVERYFWNMLKVLQILKIRGV